ncbi:MAG: hypothetical protein A4S09_09810 [Proteobacteria bacterium SG_bin7]|nr:MAG: hypothetical protein A4S09_09810 [Proteobacteria bacterium SG_bin7]
MNLYNLKIFVDTARLGSMTKASELNHLSRPAVSQAIKKLEEEIGVDLLVHQRRAIELTQPGRLLLKKSEKLLSEAERISLLVRQGKGPLVRDFKIGTSRSLATFNLPPVLALLSKEYPDVSFRVQMANSASLVKKLSHRELDFLLLIGDETLEGAKHTVLGRGHFVLVKPTSIPEKSICYAITEKRPETERLRNLYQRLHEKPLPVLAEIHSWDAIWYSVTQGICGGLVPDFLLHSACTKGKFKYEVVIPKVFPYEIKAMHLSSKSGDPLVKSFIDGLT